MVAETQMPPGSGLLGQALRFGFVGAVGFIVNAILMLVFAIPVGPLWAQTLAFPIAATVTWWLNRSYTFASVQKNLGKEWLQYVGANAMGWLATNSIYISLIVRYDSFYDNPAFALGIGAAVGMLFNFVISRWIVFRRL